MGGETLASEEQHGILPRVLSFIFEYLPSEVNFQISVSFYEIYNEKIYDLFVGSGIKKANCSTAPLDVREEKDGSFSVPNLK